MGGGGGTGTGARGFPTAKALRLEYGKLKQRVEATVPASGRFCTREFVKRKGAQRLAKSRSNPGGKNDQGAPKSRLSDLTLEQPIENCPEHEHFRPCDALALSSPSGWRNWRL